MLELVTAPAVELVSTVDAKAWLRVTTTDDDTIIADLSAAARQMAEQHTTRRFINQTWRLWLDEFPRLPGRQDPWWDGVVEGPISLIEGMAKSEVDLELAPVSAVSAIRTFALANNSATFAEGDLFAAESYFADTKSAPARVALADGYSWPTGLRAKNAIGIEFVAGYGAAATAVPGPIVTAVKLILSVLYESRGCNCEIPESAKTLLDPYVIKRL